jgi:DNA-directed RNA polymerase subunit RPC12/RpoP
MFGDKKVIEIEGGKSLACPYCGVLNTIPQRTVDELKHIQETKYVVDFRIKRMPEHPFIAHIRSVKCPSCKERFFVKDKYTVVHNGKSELLSSTQAHAQNKRR